MVANNERLASGQVTVEQWQDAFDKILLEGHRNAIEMGYKRSEGEVPDAEQLDLMARSAKDLESKYLNDFAAALENSDSRYVTEEGELLLNNVNLRSRLYVLKMRSSANEAFVNGSDDDIEFDWELGSENNCPDCPQLADLSPYTKDSLPSTPGDGDTECLGNCNCRLIREDGLAGFGRPALSLPTYEEDDEDSSVPVGVAA